MKEKLTKEEWSLIVISLEGMKAGYTLVRGWGKIGREEKKLNDLIEKLTVKINS